MTASLAGPAPSRRILVVEDNPITQKMLLVALRAEGYDVVGASDGQTALTLAEAEHPDLIIQDLVLPDIDGVELARRIRALRRGHAITLVALSGLASKLEEARTVRPGFAQLLFKPIEPSKLVEVIAATLPSPEGPTPSPYIVRKTPQPLDLHAAFNSDLAREAAEKTAQLSILTTVADVVARDIGLDDVLREVLARTLDVAGVSIGAIYLADESGHIRLACCLGYPMSVSRQLDDFFGRPDLLTETLSDGRARSLSSVEFGAAPPGGMASTSDELAFCAVVPLIASGKRVGVLVTGSAHRHLGENWVAIVSTVGAQIAQAVALAQSMARLRESEQHYRALFGRESAARAEAQMARHAAEAADLSKSRFLAVMSHELRTPLNAITGYAELLELGIHGSVTPEQTADLRRVQANARQLLLMIGEILDYTRLGAGHTDLVITDAALLDIVESAVTQIAPQLRANGLALSVQPCDRALVARADANKLTQVLVNLIGNAVKFTLAGGTVSLSCDATGPMAAIHVMDTGPGIAKEHIEHIFESFFQVDRSLTRGKGGIGLGLAISRDLMRAMHGDITVVSTPGQGARFTITLPRVAPSRLHDAVPDRIAD